MRYARFILAAVFLVTLSAMAQKPVAVTIDGKHAPFATFTRDGMVWMPVFPTASALSVAIVYEPQAQHVTLDGQDVSGTPEVRSGEVYLPADAIASALGAGMQWDPQGRTLVLTTPRYAKAHGLPKPVPPTVAAVTPPPVPEAVTPSPTVEAVPVPEVPQAAPPSNPPPTAMPTPNPNAPVQPYPGGAYAPLPSGSYPGTVPDSTIPFPTWPTRPAAGPGPAPYAAPPPPLGNVSGLPPAATPTPAGRAPTVMETFHTDHPDAGNIPEAYQPRIAANGVFSVTVTNVQSETSHRSHYSPRPGYKFVVVYLSQQNVSQEAQVYTGTFSLLDNRGASFEPAEGLSNFFLAVLRPYGVNFGYLTFEIPEESQPTRLVLAVPNGPGLAVQL